MPDALRQHAVEIGNQGNNDVRTVVEPIARKQFKDQRVVAADRSMEQRQKLASAQRPDIRAGMALLLAALAAEGQSTIRHISQIDRGYANVEEKLRALGANIKRATE